MTAIIIQQYSIKYTSALHGFVFFRKQPTPNDSSFALQTPNTARSSSANLLPAKVKYRLVDLSQFFVTKTLINLPWSSNIQYILFLS